MRHDCRFNRHTCRSCFERRALFCYRGQVRADAQHDLCFRCFRALRNATRLECHGLLR